MEARTATRGLAQNEDVILDASKQQAWDNKKALQSQATAHSSELHTLKLQHANQMETAHQQQLQLFEEVTALQCKLGAANLSLQSTKQQLRSSQDAVSILTAELEKSRAEVLHLTARPGAAFPVDSTPSKLSHQAGVGPQVGLPPGASVAAASQLSATPPAVPDTTIRLPQMASADRDAWCRAALQRRKQAWAGYYDMLPLPCNPKRYIWPALDFLRPIGKGSFGTTFYAQRRVQQVGRAAVLEEEQDWEAVVVKVLPYGDAALQELRNLLLLRSHADKSPHLTELLECYIQPIPGPGERTFVFIITRYAEGGELKQQMRKLQQRWWCAPSHLQDLHFKQWLRSLQQIMAQALQALATLHGQGLVHGDFKHDNVRLRMEPDGSNPHLVLIDMGSAVPEGTDVRPGIASRAGVAFCPFYASPEAINRRTDPCQNRMTGKADVWALGCCLYEIITDSPAFKQQSAANMTRKEVAQHAADMQDSMESCWCNRQLPRKVLDQLESKLREEDVVEQVLDMLYVMLSYDPDQRAASGNLQMHSFLHSQF